jgi:hypothetical protein
MTEPNDSDWTPCPGELIPPSEAAALLVAFEARFRVDAQTKHRKVPTWVAFDPADSRKANLRVFDSASVGDDASVFLYFEGRELRRTTMRDVQQYVLALEPWEDWDLYVFDPNLTWCIAYTHPQMGNERLVIVTGTFPMST